MDRRDGNVPVGDAEVAEVGAGMAGQAGPGVEAGATELTVHHTEGVRVEVGNCGNDRQYKWKFRHAAESAV